MDYFNDQILDSCHYYWSSRDVGSSYPAVGGLVLSILSIFWQFFTWRGGRKLAVKDHYYAVFMNPLFVKLLVEGVDSWTGALLLELDRDQAERIRDDFKTSMRSIVRRSYLLFDENDKGGKEIRNGLDDIEDLFVTHIEGASSGQNGGVDTHEEIYKKAKAIFKTISDHHGRA